MIRARTVDWRTRWLVLAAVAWTVTAGALWALVPSGSSSTTSATSSGVMTTTSSSVSLLDNEGASILIVLAIPVAIALIAACALGASRQRAVLLACGAVLAVGCVLGMLTIGIGYVPAAAMLLIAGSRSLPVSPRT